MATRKGLDTTIELTRHAAALRRQGYDFALRYYSHNAAKNLSLGEARALSRVGMQIGVVWETAGTHAGFFSRARGLADGAAAYRMAREVIGQPFGSGIYFAVDYDPTQADLDGAVGDYFTGVHAALYVAAEGQPTYRVGVYGSGLCCATLTERGQAGLSWLSQSTGFAGSRAYAEQQRYDLIQMLPVRIPGEGGTMLHVDPDASHPQREGGLFVVPVG
ncbi:DUF1906 domain-containing protein [uncultured Massilia sp.]|uniref:DUF1906 domain-containing protein n=1 Tax=uncultured Massilia sp. TaxID=169973 RepID=UPI0025DA5797|nr:DUF1906 domain-containing protein [uncultured Massilia sp.]